MVISLDTRSEITLTTITEHLIIFGELSGGGMMVTRIDTKKLHSIGEAAEICHVSRKTLRFYEELGLLVPDHVSPKNGYRYYSEDTVMLIPANRVSFTGNDKSFEYNGLFLPPKELS